MRAKTSEKTRAMPSIKNSSALWIIEAAQFYKESFLLTIFFPFSKSTSLRRRKKEIIHQVFEIGLASLPVVLTATVFAGMVLTHEIAWHLRSALGSVQMAPGFSGQFILRELAVAIPAFLLIARIGAAITAEVGSMKITDQLDALKLLKINFVEYVVFPRFIGSIIALICLTLISIAVTLCFAMLVAVTQFGFSPSEYLLSLQPFIHYKDILSALVKAAVYGSVIPVISCAFGAQCKGGAEGVGTATTQSVVSSTFAVIALDFILTYLFSIWLF